MHFRQWKLVTQITLKIDLMAVQYAYIGSDNDLVPKRRQAPDTYGFAKIDWEQPTAKQSEAWTVCIVIS